MNPGTFLVLLVVAGMVALVIRSMIKDKKAGKPSCGGDCSHCGGACHYAKQSSDKVIR